MQQCALLSQCSFFETLATDQSELVDYFLSLYCQGDYADCARYEAACAVGQERVPLDLLPNERMFTSLVAVAACRMAG